MLMFESNHHSSAANIPFKQGRTKTRKQKNVAEPLYSPKKVAAAIGVSESSLKRWCDSGVVKAVKTSGGHRKITRAEVVALTKRKNYRLRNPHSIGLPDINSVDFSSLAQARTSFLTALINADVISSQKILFSLSIQCHNIAEILDLVVIPAFLETCAKRQPGELAGNREQVASEICQKSLLELKTVIPQVASGAPVAIGVSVGINEPQFTTLGAELCLRNSGWSATSLDANLPINSILEVVVERQPSLVWISAGLVDDRAMFITKLSEMSEELPKSTRVVVFGPGAIEAEIKMQIPMVDCCENFAQLSRISDAASVG